MIANRSVAVRDSHLICKDCSSAIAADDVFCQECGVTLETVALEAVAFEAVAFEAKNVQPNKLLALRDFDYASSAKRSAMLIGVVSAIVLSIFAVMAIAGSYDAMSEDYICDHAKKLLGENDSIQATELLQRLYLARGVKLKKQTQILLGQALIKRSELYASRNQMELAIKDLKDVPPDTSEFSMAAQKLSQLQAPSPVPMATTIEPVKAVVPEPVVAKAKVSPVAVSVPVAKEPVSSIKTSLALDDVTKYNRLLTDYFEKTGAESEQTAESNSADEALKEVKSVSEPPTLKEWVNAGRPNF